jgi:hypothetical protein
VRGYAHVAFLFNNMVMSASILIQFENITLTRFALSKVEMK